MFRKCHIKYYKFIEGEKNHWYEEEGKFHQWGQELCDESVAYTVGIVELADGSIVTVNPRNIKFLD